MFTLACYKKDKFGIKDLLPMTKTKIKRFLHEDKEGASSESEDENKIAWNENLGGEANSDVTIN